MIKLGTSDMAKAYVGSSEISKMYLGSDLVYSKGPEVLPYDAEIQFLESSGTQYIDTGIYGSQNLKTILKMKELARTASRAAFGCYGSNNGYYLYQSSGLKWQVGFGGHTDSALSSDMVLHVWTFDSFNVYRDEDLVSTFTSSTFTTPQTLLLFNAHKADGTVYSSVSKRVYYCKMYENGVLVRDMIPVRVGTVGYMYDKVSRRLFGNSGSGSFIAGPDVISDIPYISNGLTYWFDGINKGNDNTKWTDLISGDYFTYNTHSTIDTNSVIMDGSGALTGNTGMGINYQTGTIEACIDRTDGVVTAAVVFYASVNSNLSFIVSGSGYCYAGVGTSNQYQITKVPVFTASLSADRGMLNGVSYTTKSSNEYTGASTTARLGGRSNGYYLYGKIHSIRIYNRLLTEEEMLFNQKVDNERFNLGLTLPDTI